jgi:hypothetical protein
LRCPVFFKVLCPTFAENINFKEADWIGALIKTINDLPKDPKVLDN